MLIGVTSLSFGVVIEAFHNAILKITSKIKLWNVVGSGLLIALAIYLLLEVVLKIGYGWLPAIILLASEILLISFLLRKEGF